MSKLTNGSLKDLIKQVMKEAPELQNLVEVGSPQPTDPAQVKARAAGQPYKVGATLVYPKEWLFKKGPAAVAQVKALVQGGRATIEGFAVQQAAEATLSGEWDALFDMESAADTAASAKAGHASGDTPMPKGSDARDLGGPPASLKPKAKRARGPFSGAASRYYGNDLNGIAKYQSHLNRVLAKHPGGGGASVKVDGKWGKKTRKATSTVQGLLGAKVDGVPGSGTFRAIHKFLKPKHATGGAVKTSKKLAGAQKRRAAQDPADTPWSAIPGQEKGRKFYPDEGPAGGGYGIQNVADRHGGKKKKKKKASKAAGSVPGGGLFGMQENNITKIQRKRKPNKMINEKKLLNVIKRVVREEMQTLKEGPLPGDLSEPVAGGEPSPWPARPGKLAKKKKRVKATRTGRAALAGLAQGPENWIATLQRLLWPYVQDSLPGDITIGEFVDGRNGPMTAIALQMFQEDHGETGDAIVGPATMAVLSDAAAEGGQSASYDVSAEEDDLEAVAQGVALPEGRVHNLFRKELLEEACGVPAKRYKIRRR